MKEITDEEYKRIMTENESLFGVYEKVKFSARINGVPRELSGIRAIDTHDKEFFIVKTENKGFVYFITEEVSEFKRYGEGSYYSAEKNEYNPATKIQETLAEKIKKDQAKASEESRNMAFALSNDLGYFPLVNVASEKDLVIEFYDNNQELMDTVVFPFVKNELYEVYDGEEEIEIPSLSIDTSIAMDTEGNDANPNLFAKYYETYNAIQDLEFVPDNKFTKEIFTLYKLNEKFTKVLGDFNKHDLLNLVTEYSKDPIIQQAARELREPPLKKNKVKNSI